MYVYRIRVVRFFYFSTHQREFFHPSLRERGHFFFAKFMAKWLIFSKIEEGYFFSINMPPKRKGSANTLEDSSSSLPAVENDSLKKTKKTKKGIHIASLIVVS